MTEWTQPKTDWRTSDSFDLYTDYARIKGNLEYLRLQAIQLYANFGLFPLGDYTIYSIPYEDFFNSIEKNLQLLADRSFRGRNFPEEKEWQENGAVWTWEDLNRIESGMELLKCNLASQMSGKHTIAFTLGGGTFAEGI